MARHFAAASAAAFALGMTAGHAQTDDAIADILACRSIADDLARLSCLDGAAGALAAMIDGPDDGGPDDDASLPAPAQDGERSFGLPQPEIARTEDEFGAEDLPADRESARVGEEAPDGEIRELKAAVVESGANPFGKVFVVLDNGQVWRQLDSDGTMVRFPRNLAATVTIRKSRFGGYRMTVDQLKRTIRVRRIK